MILKASNNKDMKKKKYILQNGGWNAICLAWWYRFGVTVDYFGLSPVFFILIFITLLHQLSNICRDDKIISTHSFYRLSSGLCCCAITSGKYLSMLIRDTRRRTHARRTHHLHVSPVTLSPKTPSLLFLFSIMC